MKWPFLTPLFAASYILAAHSTPPTIPPGIDCGTYYGAPLTIPRQLPTATLDGLQRRNDVTITATATAVQTSLVTTTRTVFITEHDISFNNVTVTTEIISTMILTVTAIHTEIHNQTEVVTGSVTESKTSTTVQVSLVTERVTDTATATTAAPVPKAKTLVQKPWFHVVLSILLTLAAFTWPLMLLGMWMQRQRSRQIRNHQHQINPEDDMALKDISPAPIGGYV